MKNNHEGVPFWVPETLLKINCDANINQGLCMAFKNVFFQEQVSLLLPYLW